MGYRTDFAIRVRNLPGAPWPMDLDDVAELLDDRIGYQVAHVTREVSPSAKYQAPLPFIEVADMKWYEHEDDLAWLAGRLPGAVVTVLGVGEDAIFGDIWTQEFSSTGHTAKTYHNALGLAAARVKGLKRSQSGGVVT